jgi:hypothetical protein
VAAESFSSDSSITAHLAVHRTLPPIAYPGFAINPGQIVWPFMAQKGPKADPQNGSRYDRCVVKAAILALAALSYEGTLAASNYRQNKARSVAGY